MITIVTPPDNNLGDEFKILLAGLTAEQTDTVSKALLEHEGPDIIVYMWTQGETHWLLDKKLKSDLIIFNAEHDDQIVVGYMAAQLNAYYFGNLRSLNSINKRVLYTLSDFSDILRRTINSHG